MDESPRGHDVTTLTMSKVQPEMEKTERDTKVLQALPCKNGMDTVKPALPNVLQVSDGTISEKKLTKRSFLTARIIEHYYRKFNIDAGNPGSIYSY